MMITVILLITIILNLLLVSLLLIVILLVVILCQILTTCRLLSNGSQKLSPVLARPSQMPMTRRRLTRDGEVWVSMFSWERWHVVAFTMDSA